MRASKKLNLRDAAIFVLLLIVFMISALPIMVAVNDATSGSDSSVYESLIECSMGGVLIDWAVITSVFIAFLIEGRATKKNLFMTFGFNQKTYYKQMFRRNAVKAVVFALIRTIYLFVLSGNLLYMLGYKDNQNEIKHMKEYLSKVKENPAKYYWVNLDSPWCRVPSYIKEVHLIYDTDRVIVPLLYIFISGFLIFLILVMTKDILDARYISKKTEANCEEINSTKKMIIRDFGNGLVFLHILLVWIICFMMFPLLCFGRFDINDDYEKGDYSLIVNNEYYYRNQYGVYDDNENAMISYIKYEYDNIINDEEWAYDSKTHLIISLVFDVTILPMEIVLPNGLHFGYGTYFQLFVMLILIASYIITWRIHKKKTLGIKDWIG